MKATLQDEFAAKIKSMIEQLESLKEEAKTRVQSYKTPRPPITQAQLAKINSLISVTHRLKVEMLGPLHLTTTTKEIHGFDSTSRCQVKYPCPREISLNLFSCIAWVSGDIWVMGGYTQNLLPSNSVYIFNTSAKQWRIKDVVLKKARCYAAAAVLGELIFVIGGRDAEAQPVMSIEVIDSKNPGIENKEILSKHSREKASACVFRGAIYVVSSGSKTMERIYMDNCEIQIEVINLSYSGLLIQMVACNKDEIFIFSDDAVYNYKDLGLHKTNFFNKKYRWTQFTATPCQNGFYFFDYSGSAIEIVDI